jgi:hypothetical protein
MAGAPRQRVLRRWRVLPAPVVPANCWAISRASPQRQRRVGCRVAACLLFAPELAGAGGGSCRECSRGIEEDQSWGRARARGGLARRESWVSGRADVSHACGLATVTGEDTCVFRYAWGAACRGARQSAGPWRRPEHQATSAISSSAMRLCRHPAWWSVTSPLYAGIENGKSHGAMKGDIRAPGTPICGKGLATTRHASEVSGVHRSFWGGRSLRSASRSRACRLAP